MMNSDLINIVDEIIKLGVEVSIYYTSGKYYVNLNTCMKSECILVYDGNDIVAEMRYGTTKNINNIHDVIDSVSSCDYGREYGNRIWKEIIDNA